jgi:hypothetical protein
MTESGICPPMLELSFALRDRGPDIGANIVCIPGYRPFLRVFCEEAPAHLISRDPEEGLFRWLTGQYEGLCVARREHLVHDAKELGDYVRSEAV